MTSKRLQSAATAELLRLAKRRDAIKSRIETRTRPLLEEIDRIDEQIDAIKRASGVGAILAEVNRELFADPSDGIVVNGRDIRICAVRAILKKHPLGWAGHYSEWRAAFHADGYAIHRNDPGAVFLTQLGRSPWVVSSTQRGVYGLVTTSPVTAIQRDIAETLARAREAADADEAYRLTREARALSKRCNEARACLAGTGLMSGTYEPQGAQS